MGAEQQAEAAKAQGHTVPSVFRKWEKPGARTNRENQLDLKLPHGHGMKNVCPEKSQKQAWVQTEDKISRVPIRMQQLWPVEGTLTPALF